MNLDQTLSALARHGIPEHFYTVGGVDGADIGCGIDHVDGVWSTYQSERGKKIARQTWPNEEEACAVFFATTIRQAAWHKVWGNQPPMLNNE